MQKSVKKWIACGLALALVLTSMIPTQSMQAASKPKLNATKKTMVVGARTSLKVSNKVKNAKYVWKTSKKSVVRVSSKGSVKAAAKGSAVISCSVKVKNKTKYTLKCKVTVTDQKVVKTQKELDSALKNSKITGITLKTNASTKFTIAAGSYTNKNLIVDAPNADVVNSGVFKSIKIKNIKSDTWTEKANGNKIDVAAKSARVVVDKDASVSSVTCSKSGSKVNLEVNGTVKNVKVTKMADVAVKVSGTVDDVTVDAASAKVDMNVEKDGTVTAVNMNASAKLNVNNEGNLKGVKINSFAQVTIEGNSEKVPVTITESGEGASLTSSVPVEVTVSSNITITLEKGAEGSAVKTTTDKVDVTVKNESQSQVTITTPTGTEKVEAGESTTGNGNSGTTDSNSGSNGSSGGSDNNGGGSTTTTKVTGVTITPATLGLVIGGEDTLKAEVTGEGNPAQTVTWTTSDEKVATVDKDGKVIAVGAGKATITATSTVDTKVSGKCEVTVSAAPKVEIKTPNFTLTAANETKTLEVEVIPSDAVITWNSSNPTVATVANGVVTAVANGTAEITASIKVGEDTIKSNVCNVTVDIKGSGDVSNITVAKMSDTTYNGLFSATGTSITITATGGSITLEKANATDVASLGAITSAKVTDKTIKVEGSLNKINNQYFVAIEIDASNVTNITATQGFVKKTNDKYAVIIAVSEQNNQFTITVTENGTSTEYTIDTASCTLSN